MWAFSLFSKSHIGHVNHGKSDNMCGVGVSSTFLAVMRCSYQFFAVLRYSEPPNSPLKMARSLAVPNEAFHPVSIVNIQVMS